MKNKKFLAMILLCVYIVALYLLVAQHTEYPLETLVVLFAAVPFSIVTHELGHLIGGLLTGYRPVSFRVFSIMLVKIDGKWRYRHLSVPGTGGQCLMAPPRMKKNGYYPFALYNLGGILLCGYLSLFLIVISFSLPSITAGLHLARFGFVSFFINLFNAIPTNGKSMVNDATNMKMARKSNTAKCALWNQLEYVSLHAQNVSTADMPKELFFMPDKTELSNPLIIWQVLAVVERLEDLGEYPKARQAIAFTLTNAPFIFPLYKYILQLEAIYLDSILGEDSSLADEYYEKLEKISALRNLASFHRASYAYLLLTKKDLTAAQNALTDYQKKIKKLPFQAEADFEQKQLNYTKQINV
jgi:hypothetical protein